MSDDVDPIEPLPVEPEHLLATDPALAAFVETLRGPATASELAGAAATIDSMLALLSPLPTSKEHRRMKHRLARTGALAAVAVLSAAGVAAAATGTNPLAPIGFGGDDAVLETIDPTTTTAPDLPATTVVRTTGTLAAPTPPIPSTTVAGAATATSDAASRPECTHGSAVSATARDRDDAPTPSTTTATSTTAPTTTTAGTEHHGSHDHGAEVSSVARATGDTCPPTGDDHGDDDGDDGAHPTTTGPRTPSVGDDHGGDDEHGDHDTASSGSGDGAEGRDRSSTSGGGTSGSGGDSNSTNHKTDESED